MQAADEGVVAAGPIRSQFAIAEFHPAIVANAQKGPLASCCAVDASPHSLAQLQVAQGHRELAALGVHVPLIHGSGDKGQGAAVGVGLLFAVPALQQIDSHLAWIEIQGIGLWISQVAKRLAIGGGKQLGSRPGPLGHGWSYGHQKGEQPHRQGNQPSPLYLPWPPANRPGPDWSASDGLGAG